MTTTTNPRPAAAARLIRAGRSPLGRRVLRRVWWLVRLLRVDLRNRPLRTALGCVLLGTGGWVWWTSTRWQDHATALTTAVVLAVTLTVWRWRARRSFDWCVGRWWGAWWRRRYLYGPGWDTLALRHGLSVTDRHQDPGVVRGAVLAWSDTSAAARRVQQRRSSVEVARLKRVRFTTGADHLLVTLPAGLTPDTVAAACDSLSHAWRARGVRVRAATPGRVWLDVTRTDTLARPVVLGSLPGISEAGTLLEHLAGLTVGVREDGTSWRLRLLGAHVLIAGTTGSGKSSLLWAVVMGLTTAIHTGLVRVTWLDPKGGMEATAAKPLADVIDRIDDMADTLEHLVHELDQRAAALAGLTRTHVPSVASPHRVVIVDELATLTALADAKTARRVEAALGALLSRGRAVGYTVITTTVDPSKDVVRWRGLHTVRVAFRLDEPIQVDMVLGDGALSRGAACDRIPLSTPGVCFVRHDGHPEPIRARATFVSDDTIAAVTRTYRARPSAPSEVAAREPVGPEPVAAETTAVAS